MRLRPILLPVVALLGSAAVTQAQVSVGLNLSQNHFMPGEAIPVSVRITNFSGQTLKLGEDNSWLRFVLEAKTGRPVASIKDVPVQGEFELPNATIATKRLDLAPCYAALKPERYLLSAILDIKSWNQRILVPTVEFDVISGTVLWERAFGVPRSPDVNTESRPETRRYALQQAVHLDQMKLYVRVTDASGSRPFAVFPIGPMLTFSTPEKQIDRQSKLHVLYQYGARSFYYCIVNPDGDLELRHTYDYAGRVRPTLGVSSEREVLVRGGARRPVADDVPSARQTEIAPSPDKLDATLPSAPPPAPPAPTANKPGP